MGQFWAVLVRMEDRREFFDRKIVSRCRERARRVYYGAVVEIKKEIPGILSGTERQKANSGLQVHDHRSDRGVAKGHESTQVPD